MNIQEYIFRMTTRTKVFAVFVILIGISYLLYSFLIMPIVKHQRRLKIDLLSQKKLLDAKIMGMERIDILEEETKKIKKKLEETEKKFLNGDRLPSFFTELRNLAQKNNVEIRDLIVSEKQPLDPHAPVKDIKHEVVPVNISLSSTYLNTLSFLAQLREKNTLFTISKIYMVAKDEEGKSIETNLQLNVYLVY